MDEQVVTLLESINETLSTLLQGQLATVQLLQSIQGDELFNSISDVYEKLDSINDKLDDIKGAGVFNSISDVCDKLDEVDQSLSSIEMSMV